MTISTVFLSHGGGPMPLLNDPTHVELIAALKKIPQKIKTPKSIIVVSAHWEETGFIITGAKQPELIYDYYGFPRESYAIKYPAPGNPDLADLIHKTLTDEGLTAAVDPYRGFDHGVFVPLKLMYPEANIPCVQVSLNRNLDARSHIQLGKALAKLNVEDCLIIGSGLSFHNLRAFFSPSTADMARLNREFESWLNKTCCTRELSENERENILVQWQLAPGAQFCHPRPEHLIPLHVCYGVAQSSAKEVLHSKIMGKESSCIIW